MKKRTIYIGLFLIFIIGVLSLIGTFAIDSIITEGNSSNADYLFNITLGDRTDREIVIPSYDSKIVDIKISNPNEFNMSYLLYLEGINSSISIINISDTEASGVLNSKNTNLIKVFIQNNGDTDITVSIKDVVGFERETLSLPSNSTAISKGPYYKVVVKPNDKTYGKVKPNIKLSTKNGTVKYNIVPNTGYKYKSTTCEGTVVDNILTISNITSNMSCEVVFEPINVQISLDLTGGKVETIYTEAKEYTYIVPYTGNYKIELWGAQGGGVSSLPGGYGGYVSGSTNFAINEKIYVYVGENYNGYKNEFSFNGGGKGSYSTTGSTVNYNGGGATDVRYFGTYTPTDDDLQWNSTIGLNSRIMVAAGGGGYSSWSSGIKGGSAGGLVGYDGNAIGTITVSTGGTQISGGVGTDNKTNVPYVGVFGIGGYNNTYSSGYIYNSGGGGGYYGGGSGGSISGSVGSAAGGSSYISGHTGCVAITSQGSTTPKSGCTSGTTDINCSVHFSGKKFANTVMIDGLGCSWTSVKGSLQQMPNLTGGYYASGMGKVGNGAARITLTSIATYDVTYNEKYNMLPSPTKIGYVFDGWYTGENGTGTKITNDTILTNANNHTLYAKWTKKKVVVNFDGNKYITESNSITRNGLTFTYDPDTSYLTINGTPTANFTALNYDYGMSFNEGEKYTINTTYISGNVTNSGTGVGRAGIDVIKESLANVSTRNFASASITDKSSNGTLTISSVGASEGTGLKYWVWFTTATDWTFTNYVIKVDVTKVESKTIQYGDKYGTMPTLTRTGYVFEGWYTGENGTGTKVDENTVLTNVNDHTLYAKWTANIYTISYNLNGGTKGSSAPTSGTYGSTVTVSNPTRTNYTFTGWTVSGTGASMSGTSLKIGVGNITLTANWKSNRATLYDYIKNKADTSTSIDFSQPSSTNGIYMTTDTDSGNPVYYYRGNVDNHIIFANFCWRIVRTTETGGVKLIYDGVPSNGQCNNTGPNIAIGASKFNESASNAEYVGYMYGSSIDDTANTNDSTIKGVIDDWYKTNMTSYTSQLEDTVFCNDRSHGSYLYFGAWTRLYDNKTPTLKCQNAKDKFTVEVSNGNGALTYPVGLITADEIAYAGGVYARTNKSFYLYMGLGQFYWIMSPAESAGRYAGVFSLGSDGQLAGSDVTYSRWVRPVVSLKSEAAISGGLGTSADPFIVLS